MLRGVNIIQILKMLLIILMAAFMLTACSKETEDPATAAQKHTEQSAFTIDDETGQKEVAAQHRECWQTGMIDMLYENMGKVALGMYAKITDGAAVHFDFRKENASSLSNRMSKDSVQEEVKYIEKPLPKIVEIRIFFDNGTYQVFRPEKS